MIMIMHQITVKIFRRFKVFRFSYLFLGETKQDLASAEHHSKGHLPLSKKGSKEIIRLWTLFWVSVMRNAAFSCFIWLKPRLNSAVQGLKTLIISRISTSLSYPCGVLSNIGSLVCNKYKILVFRFELKHSSWWMSLRENKFRTSI